ncbi:hypothetical protein COY23_04235 [bacterium (Candidatus Torokbacteria) CG_4_10_14_0_2_um_filter_35_8]|nr:MAG: hypothetical protein COY23_04235 [bacterium (Candidatus Torokbacteria) CG_4_10_14_0_2_um_filter_35_8]
MEKLIQDLQEDLRNIIEGKKAKILRKKSGDMVDIRILRMIDFSLQWASVGYQSALRFAGMKFGRRLGEISSSSELSLILEEIKKIIEELKEGEVELEISAKKNIAQLRIYESSLVSSVPNVSQSLCFFKEGFIEGYLEGVIVVRGSFLSHFRKVVKVEVKETKCQGRGDNFCQFTIVLK